MAVPEAALRATKYGLVPDGEGWFVLNAREHGAGVTKETTKSAEAYARFPPSTRTQYRDGWLPEF